MSPSRSKSKNAEPGCQLFTNAFLPRASRAILVNGITGSLPGTITGWREGVAVGIGVGGCGLVVGNTLLITVGGKVVGCGTAVDICTSARSGSSSSDDLKTNNRIIARHKRTAKDKKAAAKDNANIDCRIDITSESQSKT